MTVSPFKENTWIPDRTFPINVFIVKDVHLHWHDHMEWVYVKEGRARVQVDASFMPLHKGELAFINTKQLHGVVTLEPDTELICIVFNEALVRGSGLDITEHHYFVPYLQQQVKWPSLMQATAPCIDEMNRSFARLVEEFQGKQPGYELLVKAELLRIFGLYFRYAQQHTDLSLPRAQKSYDFSHLLQTLRERYRESISVNDAARMVNLSPTHFCKIFKQVTGKTLIEYIHMLRVQEAERMLLDTDYPVAEIAERAGFSNMTYFGRVFKKVRNLTPSAIRKGHLSQL
ncbi:AraC family transcriptional regulator [Paenibacillus lignilyticus]|uniref:Helix-turn-helix transcriptional regulator n=1 Tax=Paenibacillus lignilyticus TaxID=1172615 RepID=A0ABS5CCE3_9BACL|nr:AraC family transcriptional regulator [Paenibacillus lignilyticus]MBP3961663.1 helix-turn-helix transcriptional regulator [Paenibacillus lignilyticus]MBP3963667.1 helix-turn-helix transcriptional regulator [Paenibacillus lignilyticus]